MKENAVVDGLRSKPRWTYEDGHALVAELAASGLDDEAFAKMHGIKPSRVAMWRRRLANVRKRRRRSRAQVAFAPVTVPGRPEPKFIIETSGLRIEVVDPDATPVSWIAELVQAVPER